MDAGILPVKSLSRAKGRLSEHFDDSGRSEIARALLEDALELCKSAPFLTWWVTSDDQEALMLAQSYGFNTVPDQTGTLNGALQQSVVQVLAEGAQVAARLWNMVKGNWGVEIFSPEETSAENEMSVVQYANIAGKRIVLTGDARIIENENQLGGDRITLFMREDRSFVEGGKVIFYQDKVEEAGPKSRAPHRK